MDRTFCGYTWDDLDRVLTLICNLEDDKELTESEQKDYDIAIQCIAQIMNCILHDDPIVWD